MIGVFCSLGVLLQRIMANYRAYPFEIHWGIGFSLLHRVISTCCFAKIRDLKLCTGLGLLFGLPAEFDNVLVTALYWGKVEPSIAIAGLVGAVALLLILAKPVGIALSNGRSFGDLFDGVVGLGDLDDQSFWIFGLFSQHDVIESCCDGFCEANKGLLKAFVVSADGEPALIGISCAAFLDRFK